MEIKLYKNDLPDGLDLGNEVAIDTETMGLNPLRDRLCLVQLSAGDGVCHLVQMTPEGGYDAPNLRKLLDDENVLKLFHFARFDLAVLYQFLQVMPQPLYCTKIVSKLVRTYTERHGLKELCRHLLGVEISKHEQTSDWGAETLTEDQQKYAANDVLYLHKLREKLDEMLEREGRQEVAEASFGYLPYRAWLDINGWREDIFAH